MEKNAFRPLSYTFLFCNQKNISSMKTPPHGWKSYPRKKRWLKTAAVIRKQNEKFDVYLILAFLSFTYSHPHLHQTAKHENNVERE